MHAQLDLYMMFLFFIIANVEAGDISVSMPVSLLCCKSVILLLIYFTDHNWLDYLMVAILSSQVAF